MSCNTRYWHSISCAQSEKPANPALAQENNKNLQALLAAREAQDAKWSFKPSQDQLQGQSNQTQKK